MISEANALGVEGHDDLEQLMLMGSSNLAQQYDQDAARGNDVEMTDEEADKENQAKDANKLASQEREEEDVDSQDLLDMVEKQGIVVKNSEDQQEL